MSVKFPTYNYSFEVSGKRIYFQSKWARKKGEEIKNLVENAYNFEDYFYHLKKGGHISAIHSHRQFRFFCKLDIENFFYSINRNRVQKKLKKLKIPNSQFYSKVSCIKDPNYSNYVLPIGFKQSPVLSSLVLAKSTIGDTLYEMKDQNVCNISVYVDDICLSSNNLKTLQECYNELKNKIEESNFSINKNKSREPCEEIEIFNCSLKYEKTLVLPNRITYFNNRNTNPASKIGFDNYCSSVEIGNR